MEFRLGEIENLPVAAATVDVIISNGVLNLSIDKGRVLSEARRVLKPGGRRVISDMVSEHPVPEVVAGSLEYGGFLPGSVAPRRHLVLWGLGESRAMTSGSMRRLRSR